MRGSRDGASGRRWFLPVAAGSLASTAKPEQGVIFQVGRKEAIHRDHLRTPTSCRLLLSQTCENLAWRALADGGGREKTAVVVDELRSLAAERRFEDDLVRPELLCVGKRPLGVLGT
ncbi:MAG: hypothetical protein KatS3mg077_0553 [Candidatus Binatia bacterium]|nr:MAG: hypothetical protein KatS3mg077_0553 [Candidatus Binatia bacterium]